MYKPIILVVLDGFGLNANIQGNPIKIAETPTLEKLNKFYPMVALQASGISVGLPWKESGNSEVGHIALGAGKIIYQNMPRITLAIQDSTFFKNEALIQSMQNAYQNQSSLHIMGLISQGTVHSYIEHLYALIELTKEYQLTKVFLHAFTDGRDSPPTSAAEFVKKMLKKIPSYGNCQLASLCGRNWVMDRNNNWDRIEKAYNMLTKGIGEKFTDPVKYIKSSYQKGINDEYLEPGVMYKEGVPLALIKDKDSVIFFNFREDRARQITKAFTLPGFEKFNREKRLSIDFTTMIEYEKDLPVSVAFPPEKVTNGLGEILSKHKKNQLRIAETEKYAHVTYFFNGGRETPWPLEDRFLIPSPTVATYDLAPEMSADKLTQKIIDEIAKNKYDFILVNYANADMVGHTGNKQACIEALQAIDKSLARLIPVALGANGCILITSDHGNIENIKNFYTGETDTEHSTNPVPVWLLTPTNHREKSAQKMVREQTEVQGLLSDVAPTILDLMGIEEPKEMTGNSLMSALK